MCVSHYSGSGGPLTQCIFISIAVVETSPCNPKRNVVQRADKVAFGQKGTDKYHMEGGCKQ